MFGVFRTLLALVVVADHFLPWNGAGAVAVFWFYCLSGYLMTKLTAGVYKNRPGAFLINRALRLYPSYLVVFVATFIAIRYMGYQTTAIIIPADTGRLLAELLYYNEIRTPLVVPTAWAVTNELIFYVLIALGVTSTARKASLFLLMGALATLTTSLANGFTIFTLYFTPIGAAVPFALGGLLSHVNLPQRYVGNRVALLGCVCAAALLGLAMYKVAGQVSVDGTSPHVMKWLYISLVPCCAAIVLLDSVRCAPTIDDLIGRLSYPIYLVQWLAAALVSTSGFTNVLLATCVLAAALALLIDAPVECLRRRVRVRV